MTCGRLPGYKRENQAVSRPAWPPGPQLHSLPLGSSLPGLQPFSLRPRVELFVEKLVPFIQQLQT